MMKIIKPFCRRTFRWVSVLVLATIGTYGAFLLSNSDAPTINVVTEEITLSETQIQVATAAIEVKETKPVAVKKPTSGSVPKKEVPTHSYDQRQVQCLTQNIYYEAGSESWEGKVAVAQVTMNRLDHGKFGRDICGVVFQRTAGNGIVICQFTWTCTVPAHGPLKNENWAQAAGVAHAVYYENLRLSGMERALYFHNTKAKPNWNLKKLRSIGNHVFYGHY
jgi:spore germination cell wall hydrolase CwlJ-like protein